MQSRRAIAGGESVQRIRTRGMFLVEGNSKFFVRGVSYGPFRLNPMGEPFPEKPTVEGDLALLRALGANTLRLYHVPPDWLRELVAGFGMRVLVGIPWAQHIRFLDSRRTREEVRNSVRDAARSLASTPNVLALLVGNEVPPQVVRWYGPRRIERFVEDLADEVKQVDPDLLVSYANFPMTEYLEIPSLDFTAFNVYLHREQELRSYVARLQNLAGPRPLVLTEFGADSIREGEARQADIVGRTAVAAAELGCAGTVVFSFTDEWHTGGFDIDDWAFGLVTRDREPKPAFHAVQRLYRFEIPALPEPAPMVSVVVCAYNEEQTIGECLESLRRLRYPNFEVIIVDDGSTDETRAIAERYPEFVLISHENRGLSVARNEGILAARGEVIAFTDSDCAVDPDWLTFLVNRLLSGDFAGMGGSSPPPSEGEWVPDAIAHAPGGATHVLLTDEEAEHVPGCNMAFWRERLVEIGLFDSIFRTAGDDVDICWRLRDAGYRIGFAAAALVWHHRRRTVAAYLKQQRGYGRAEALLYAKHPSRFNSLGHSRWVGRIYSNLGHRFFAGRPVIYWGPLGGGLFQSLYQAPSPPLRHLPMTLEWNLAALGLAVIAGASYGLGTPVPMILLVALAGLSLSVAQAILNALEVDANGLPPWRAKALIAALSYLGPLVRAAERWRHRGRGAGRFESIGPPPRLPVERDRWHRTFRVSYWNETAMEKETCVGSLLELLKARSFAVVPGGSWDPWDLWIGDGLGIRGEIRVLIQNHGGSKRQVDAGVWLRQTPLARAGKAAVLVGAIVALASGAGTIAGVLAAAALGAEVFLCYRADRLGRIFHRAVDESFRELPLDPLDCG